MAACQIKLEDYHTAITNCTQVLTNDKSNAKALFRWARWLLGGRVLRSQRWSSAAEMAVRGVALVDRPGC
jgi:hypothetical protein